MTTTASPTDMPESTTFTAELIDFIESDVATFDDTIEPGTDLLLTGLVDSLGVVMVSSWIQDRLSITIDPGDIVLENFQTVAQMVAYVELRGAVRGA